MRIKVKFDPDAREEVVKSLISHDFRLKSMERVVGTDEFELNVENFSEEQRDTVKNLIKSAVLKHRLKNLDQYDDLGIQNLTKEKIDSYIESHVTDLESAKTYLKKLSYLVLYLYKKLMDIAV